MKKHLLLLFGVISFFTLHINAQQTPRNGTFKGFHLGITTQGELFQKCNVLPMETHYYVPIPSCTYGGEMGIELSYHFARYFGFSLGINYGTILAYKYKLYGPTADAIGIDLGWEKMHRRIKERDFFYPIKFEFHYPLKHNFYFVSDIGIKIRQVGSAIFFRNQSIGYSYHSFEASVGTGIGILPLDTPIHIVYFFEETAHVESKIEIDLLLNVGIYYRLPWSDLLRCTVGVNLTFQPYAIGYYVYPLQDKYGYITKLNSFVGLQLSYIHTFNFEKTKKFIRKNKSILPEGVSYSNKKERNRYILNLLKQ